MKYDSKYILNLMVLTAVIVFCIQVFSDNKVDVDIWGNVGFVKAMPWQSEFLYKNTFSFTEPNHKWINHEWLAEYIFHTSYIHFGNIGLLAVKTVLGLLVVLIISISMKKSSQSSIVRFFYLLLIISTMGYGFSVRPHHFTYLMYTLFLFLIKDHQLKPIITFPAILLSGILWGNIHGAFFIGALLLILYAVIEVLKSVFKRSDSKQVSYTAFIIAALFIIGTFFNPYGLNLWKFIFQSAAKTRPYLSEWAIFHPVRDFWSHVDFMILSIITLPGLIFSKKYKNPTWMGIIIISFISAIMMRRNIPLFAITAGILATEHVDDISADSISKLFKRIPHTLIIIILSIFILASSFYTIKWNKDNPTQIEVPRNKYPVDVINFIKNNNISGNAIVFFDWAEYCIWKLYPDCRIFLDGRFRSAYSLKVIEDYFNYIYLGNNWDNAINNYPSDIALLHKQNPVYNKMLSNKEWIMIYDDQIAGLFLKKDKHEKIIETLKNKPRIKQERQKKEFFP